LKELSKENLC